MIGYDAAGWVLHPGLKTAIPIKLGKSKGMFLGGLQKKAQRELACGILAGEANCKTGHCFQVHYRCGNRYCPTCAPLDGRKLFARQADKLLFAATRLMLCGKRTEKPIEGLPGSTELIDCEECSKAIAEKRLPHWPPPPRREQEEKPKIVCATIDFTYRHEVGSPMPTRDLMRELNHNIKRFCRALERRFKISRKQYGLAYCDEFGGTNSNPHAHAIYVGPWLPQSKGKAELSALWYEITGHSFRIHIKYAKTFGRALFHAIKYPAKFATQSSGERLAELEIAFHGVRRFHTLAAFYNPEAPPSEKPPAKRCPICDEPLSEPKGWFLIVDLDRKGLREVDQVRAEIIRDRALSIVANAGGGSA